MDSVDNSAHPEILDFYDERNEDNPLIYKNPELRAEVAAMNAAIRKALPSLKDFDSSNEPTVVLTRDELLADAYRNKPSFLDWKPVGNKTMTEDDVKFFTPPDDLDEVLDAKLGTDFVRQKKEKQEAERKKEAATYEQDSVPSDCNVKNEELESASLGLYAEHAAARGDGFETVEQPEVKSITIDIRPPKTLTEIIESSNNVMCDDEKMKMKLDVQSPEVATEKGAMETSTDLIHLKEGFANGDKTSTSDDVGERKVPSKPSTVPRACANSDKQSQWDCKDLNPHLLREVFEIRPGQASKDKSHAPSLPKSVGSELELSKDVAENVADVFEMNNRVSDAWDWVTAIPRAYYMEEGNLLECFRKRACYLSDTLDFRILKETFRSSCFYSNTKECSRESRPPNADGKDSRRSMPDDAPPLPTTTTTTKNRQKENSKLIDQSKVFIPSKSKVVGVKKRVEPLNEIDPNVRRGSHDPSMIYKPEPPTKF